jgi:hypothetical protein
MMLMKIKRINLTQNEKNYIENVLYSSNKNEIYVDDRKIKIKMKKITISYKKNFFKFLVFF